MNLTYACIPASVLFVCVAEMYRYLKANYIGKWRIVDGKPQHEPRHWYTKQDIHIHLVARAIASLTALVLGIVIWLKLAIAEPTPPAIFLGKHALYTHLVAWGVVGCLWLLTKYFKETLRWQFDLFFLLMAVALPFAVNAVIFASVAAATLP